MSANPQARPGSIRRFEQLFLASMFVTIIAIMLDYGTLRSQAIAEGSSPIGPLLGIFLTLLINLPLWHFIARRASRLSKWILVVLTGFGIAMLPATYAEFFAVGITYALLNILAFGLSLAAIVALFRQDAVVWLKSGGTVGSVNPDIFT